MNSAAASLVPAGQEAFRAVGGFNHGAAGTFYFLNSFKRVTNGFDIRSRKTNEEGEWL
jgi:hypothetical protein